MSRGWAWQCDDWNVRMCLGCKGMFAPYSMGKDGEPVVEPPVVAYRCMTCRTKQTGTN